LSVSRMGVMPSGMFSASHFLTTFAKVSCSGVYSSEKFMASASWVLLPSLRPLLPTVFRAVKETRPGGVPESRGHRDSPPMWLTSALR
jgi:hypothetical protein